MPRPRKCRMVCRLPGASEFVPLDGRKDASPIVLTVDEFEALRLIDGEDYSQEQCGEQMHIARATVQQIVDSARKKISFALVEGRPLKILGGEYRLCEGGAARCPLCAVQLSAARPAFSCSSWLDWMWISPSVLCSRATNCSGGSFAPSPSQ